MMEKRREKVRMLRLTSSEVTYLQAAAKEYLRHHLDDMIWGNRAREMVKFLDLFAKEIKKAADKNILPRTMKLGLYLGLVEMATVYNALLWAAKSPLIRDEDRKTWLSLCSRADRLHEKLRRDN